MSDPINPLDAAGNPSAAGGSPPPTGGDHADDITRVIFQYQKTANQDERADRALEAESRELAAQARAARLDADNTSVQNGMDEAAEKRNTLMWVGIGLLVLGVIAGAILVFARGLGRPHTDNAEVGDYAVVTPPQVAPGGAIASPPAGSCGLKLVSPLPANGIPLTGPIELQWTGLPGATAYALEVSPPAGGGSLWQFSTSETSKRIYMENFPAGGDYQVSLKALSGTGDVLCNATLQFTKQTTDLSAKKSGQDNGSSASGPALPPCIKQVCPP